MRYKKGLGEVIALTLILLVAISSAVYFSGWYQRWNSESFTNQEMRVDPSLISIEHIDGNTVYVRNNNNKNVSISDVKIGGVSCDVNGSVGKNGIYEIDLGTCLQGSSHGPKEVVLITEGGVLSSTKYLDQNYVSLAYNLSELWSKTYAPEGYLPLDDEATDIDVDVNGNVYVTGYYYDLDYNEVYSTVKYNSSGNEVWNRSFIYASYLAVDGSDNIYTAGSVYDSNMDTYDFFIAKYDSVGNQIWNISYDVGDLDISYDIAIDGSGNVYVTGDSRNDTSYSENFYTIKLDTNGNVLWSARYDSAADSTGNAIAVDSLGNVYVAGYLVDSWRNCYIIKYNSSGSRIWNISNGGVWSQECYDIAVDVSNNIYVTGRYEVTSSNSTFYTAKYDSNGNQIWNFSTGKGGGLGIDVDSDYNIYITGYNSNSTMIYYYNTSKYNSSRSLMWSVIYTEDIYDSVSKVEVDTNFNVHLIQQNTLNSGNYISTKYNSSGNEQWNKSTDTQVWGNYSNYANGIAVDTNGNIYVTGDVNNGSNFNYYTIKYDSNGNEIFNISYLCVTSCGVSGIAVDNSGNVYVAGYLYSNNTGVNSNFFVIKYDSSGNELGNFSYDYNGYADYATAIAIDENNNFYLTGNIYNGSKYKYYTAKYDSTGDEIWNKTYFSGIDVNTPDTIYLDDIGNVYVGGRSGSWSNIDGIIIKYDNNGNEIWIANFSQPDNEIHPMGITVDSLGNVYVAGSIRNQTDYTYKALLVKYDSSGNELWNLTVESASENQFYDIALDLDNNIYVGGFGNDNVIKYSSEGVKLWNISYVNGIVIDEIVMDANNNLYVTGEGGAYFEDYLTIKYG